MLFFFQEPSSGSIRCLPTVCLAFTSPKTVFTLRSGIGVSGTYAYLDITSGTRATKKTPNRDIIRPLAIAKVITTTIFGNQDLP